jgi:hypothetical protein
VGRPARETSEAPLLAAALRRGSWLGQLFVQRNIQPEVRRLFGVWLCIHPGLPQIWKMTDQIERLSVFGNLPQNEVVKFERHPHVYTANLLPFSWARLYFRHTTKESLCNNSPCMHTNPNV